MWDQDLEQEHVLKMDDSTGGFPQLRYLATDINEEWHGHLSLP